MSAADGALFADIMRRVPKQHHVSFTACCRCYGQQREDEHLNEHADGFLRALSKMLGGRQAVQDMLPQLVQLLSSANKRATLLRVAAQMTAAPAACGTAGAAMAPCAPSTTATVPQAAVSSLPALETAIAAVSATGPVSDTQASGAAPAPAPAPAAAATAADAAATAATTAAAAAPPPPAAATAPGAAAATAIPPVASVHNEHARSHAAQRFVHVESIEEVESLLAQNTNDIWTSQPRRQLALVRCLQYVQGLCASPISRQGQAQASLGQGERERPLKAWHVISINEYRRKQPRVLVLTSTAYYRLTWDDKAQRVSDFTRVAMMNVEHVEYDINLGGQSGPRIKVYSSTRDGRDNVKTQFRRFHAKAKGTHNSVDETSCRTYCADLPVHSAGNEKAVDVIAEMSQSFQQVHSLVPKVLR